jgi:hypothetical protein
MKLAFNVEQLQCADSIKLGLSKDISMSMYMCLIEAGVVYTACSVVRHMSPNRKCKVESRTEQIYTILREDIQIL